MASSRVRAERGSSRLLGVVPSPPHWRVRQVAGHGMGAAALEDVADHRQDVWWAHQIEFDQEH